MNIITQKARYCQAVIKYSLKKGVSEASIRYKISRKTIYKWRKRYDGTLKSLYEQSRKPHNCPHEHSENEYKLIKKLHPYYANDKIRLWSALCEKGYKRSYRSLLRALKRLNLVEARRKKVEKPKPYARAEYPGQKIQIDVKYVPSKCVANGQKYYQYTAIDECTRVVFREIYDEQSTYSSKDFLLKTLSFFSFPVRKVQTDNGSEFTKALLTKNPASKSLFEAALVEMDVIYKRIRVATPRHNGKVERQHGLDEKRFFSKFRMYSLLDGRQQIARYNKLSNNIPKICLNFRSPNDVLADYLAIMF